MDHKDGKRGFSGLSDLATDISDQLPPLTPSAEKKPDSVVEESAKKNNGKRTKSPNDNKAFSIIVGVTLIAGLIYLLTPSSSGTGNQQAKGMNATTRQTSNSTPVPAKVPAKVPIRTVSAQQVYNEISSVLPNLKTINHNQAAIKGKLLVWDQSRNIVSDIQKKVPDDLQWKENYDGKTTMMVITGYSDKQTGTYGSDIPAYKRTANISLVSWPDKTPIGRIAIVGDDPPQSIRYKTRPSAVYGEINQPIINWINRCQRIP